MPRNPFQLVSWLLPILLLVAFGGCGTTPPLESATLGQSAAMNPLGVEISPAQMVGTLVRIDSANQIAVLEASAARPPGLETSWLFVSLSSEGTASGVLQAANVRYGDLRGLFIIGGNPQPGHRVIIPHGPAFDQILEPYRRDQSSQ